MIKNELLRSSLGLLALAYLLGLTACSTTRIVKPLQEKEVMVGVDFGWP